MRKYKFNIPVTSLCIIMYHCQPGKARKLVFDTHIYLIEILQNKLDTVSTSEK